MTDGVGGYTELYNVASITPITIGASTFVLAAAVLDSGIQIINITDPYNPTPAYAISDNVGGMIHYLVPHILSPQPLRCHLCLCDSQ